MARIGVAMALAFATMLVFSALASSALAATGHPFLGSFSLGQNSWPRGIAIDGSDYLYVHEAGAKSGVAKYTTAGVPVPFTGSAGYIHGNKIEGTPDGTGGNPEGYPYSIAVDSSGGPDDGYIYMTNLYGPSGSTVYVYNGSGIFLGTLGGDFDCGVAVDQANGDVYTGDFASGGQANVKRYAPPVGDPSDDVAEATLTFPINGENQTCPIKVDESGNVYVNGNGRSLPGEGLLKFAPSQFGVAEPAFIALSPYPDPGAGLTLLPSGGYYVDHETDVVKHDAAGAQVGSPFPSAALSESRGVAADSSGNVYVTESAPNGAGGVSAFGPTEVELPLAISATPTGVIQTSVHATGEVKPDGAGGVTECEFVYGPDAGYTEGSVPCSPEASVGSPIGANTAVSADITGLTSGTRYHYRLIAGNANGAAPGSDEAFETLVPVPGTTTEEAKNVGKDSAELNGSFTGNGEDTHYYFEYGKTESYGSSVPASPADAGSPSGETHVAPITVTGLEGATEYHFRLVATNKYGTSRGGDLTFTTPVSISNLTTDPPSGVTDTSAELNGSFDADGRETHYFFEWGETASYGHSTPAPPGDLVPGTSGRVHVPPIEISGLGGGFSYHYRVVASNSSGTTYGQDVIFKTAEAPTVSNINSRDLQPTAAELVGEVNPRYGETTYEFEWGSTTNYGNVTPVPAGDAGSGNASVPVSVALEGLEEGVTYHFRLVATNQYGSTASSDQSFGFYPSECPNAQLRQETHSNALPDCRAYELVTPTFANGALVAPRGGPGLPPNATSPSRIAYSVAFGIFPEEDGHPTNEINDIYVSSRGATGWHQRYTGLPSNEVGSMAGPPTYYLEDLLHNFHSFPEVTDGTQASPNLDRILSYSQGLAVTGECGGELVCTTPNGVSGPSNGVRGQPSNAGFVFNSESGAVEGRFPTNLAEKGKQGEQFVGLPEASADFSHYVFQSDTPYANSGPNGPNEEREFYCCAMPVPHGLEPEPIYDNDIETGITKLASLKEDNSTQFKGYTLHTSENGSRILMSEHWTQGFPPYGGELFPVGYRGKFEMEGPLYLRVNGEETIEFLAGRHFSYAGSTADGKTVYIRSSEQLTPDDHDHSADLFVWHEESPHTLTRISVGDFGNAGNEDECEAEWSGGGCNVEVLDFLAYSQWSFLSGAGQGGNAISDQALASNSGDLYFLSPERLVEGKGEEGQANLYVYRHGAVQYVATMNPSPVCTFLANSFGCASGPVARMEVTPNGDHMAFVVNSNITGYNSAGHTEMYTYDPESGRVTCASCRPDGQPPTSEVLASQNGAFQTNDGRVFFSTSDSLTPKDSDGVEDVYEFSEGRPQLISSGTGSAPPSYDGYASQFSATGLVGVSADGTDVYFATIDTLVSQDHNGSRPKIYDARVGGGFPAERTPPDCEAADECHGPSSEPPVLPPDRTSAELGTPTKQKAAKHKKKHKHHKKKHAKKKSQKKKASKRAKHHG